MINIRYGTFETNSSSVHSLMIATDKEYEQLTNGELYIDSYNGAYISQREVVAQLLRAIPVDELLHFWQNELEKTAPLYANYEWFEDLPSEEFDAFLEEFCDGIHSFDSYGGEWYDRYDEDYTTEHGDHIHIFGYYGHD